MLHIQNLQHLYQNKKVLEINDWQVSQGEQCLLLGDSGSGKTTLLHCIAGLLKPSKGKIFIHQQDLTQLKGAALDKFRAKNIGLIFQKPHLIQTLSVLQNLLLAQYAAGIRQDTKHCESVLMQLQLSHRKNALPKQLSQGEAQRVSVGRALLNQPQLLLADEPTASLDDKNALQVIELLKQQAKISQATLVIATHDRRVKDAFEKRLDLSSSLA